MRTITILNWRRPGYTLQALQALDACREREKWRLLISVDSGAPESYTVLTVCSQYAHQSPHAAYIDIRYNPRPDDLDGHIGATHAAHRAFQWAFDERESEFNLAIEDDCLLSPDALELCDWFLNLPERERYLLMSVSWITDKYERPLDVHESTGMESGWCLAMPRKSWREVVAPTWDTKKREPYGWDWALTYQMIRRGLVGLYPVLPRARNIGRENGVHTQTQWWDKTIGPMVASDGSHGKDYRITDRWDGQLLTYPWMQPEIEYEQKQEATKA